MCIVPTLAYGYPTWTLQQVTRKFWENLEKIYEFFGQTSLEVSEYLKKENEKITILNRYS